MPIPDLSDLFSANPKIKYACSKNLIALAKENPAVLYPQLDFFVELLDNENRIMRWTAIDILGGLARVDKTGKVDKYIDRIAGFLNTGKLITANHAIAALTDIALAKPEHRAKVAGELLKVEHYNYDTDECWNIAIGKALLAFDAFCDKLEDGQAVMAFAGRQAANTRAATAKKAAQFLNKHPQN